MALPSRGQLPLTVVVRRYTSHRRSVDRLAPSTVRGYGVVLINFAEVVGPLEVGAVQPRHVTRYVRVKTKDGLSTAALGTYLSRLKMFAAWCVSEGYAVKNWMAGAHHPRRPRSVPRALNPDEIRATIAACETPRERLVCVLMWQQGLRCIEVSRLQRCDLDLDGRLMLVKGKAQHQRELPITEAAALELHRYLEAEPVPSSGFVVRNARDDRSQLSAGAIGEMVAEVFRRAGVKRARYDGRSAHAYRHSLANELLDNDVDIRTVQEILGHVYPSTTLNVYGNRRRTTGPLRAALENRA